MKQRDLVAAFTMIAVAFVVGFGARTPALRK
jgi:hypothetical protein